MPSVAFLAQRLGPGWVWGAGRRLLSSEAAARLATELGEGAVCLPTSRSKEIHPEYFFKGPFLFLSSFFLVFLFS